MKKSLFSLFMMFFAVSAYSQNSDFGNWLIYIGNKKINNNWNWHHEVQYRNYNAIGDLEQLLLRTGIGYNLTENNNNLLLGYGFIHSQNYIDNSNDKLNVNEHRIFQQFITKQKFSRISFQHRYRFEQRWIEETDFRMRFRYFLSLNIALNNKEVVDKTLYASIYNEIFINNTINYFDRNRIYLGVGYKLNRNTKFEIGYMNQILINENRDQLNLITFLTF